MLKSCTYCGRVHDSRIPCQQKQNALSRYYREKSPAVAIRNTARWQKTRDYIKRRDHGVCQLCLRNYKGTLRQYEYQGLGVHHITSIEDDAGRAFDEENLITLCGTHHEAAEKGEIDKGTLWDIARENEERYGDEEK